MLDLPRLERIKLSARPLVQRVIGVLGLMPNYHLPPRVRLSIEGLEHLPDEPVVFAMNHTDRYNYWPFQYQLWRKRSRYTATWVKGKYYEHPFTAKFMELTNNIPTVSRGYLITRDLLATLGRRPTDDEYKLLRAWVDRVGASPAAAAEPPDGVPTQLLQTPRDMLGRPFDPANEDYATAMNALFHTMMRHFVRLNARAFELGLDMLVFPEGTRSIRLSRGHIGLAEIALAYDKLIVPVGCNGSDRIYPGSSPLAKGGRVTYRIGRPITRDEMARFRPEATFQPFSADAEAAYRPRFQGLVDLVMERINELLDPRHRFADDDESDAVTGSNRFV